MSSFTTIIDNLILTLQNDADLSAFCIDKWGKSLSVKNVFRQRTELSLSDLPIILITRPNLEKSFLTGNARDARHTVRFYAGFYEPNRDKALAELIAFEECIDDALIAPEPSSLGAINILPKSSVNDEGEYHPTYFLAMDIEITHRR